MHTDEPDSALSYCCPYCLRWFTRPGFCDNRTHSKVALDDAIAMGNLTPWQVWRKEKLEQQIQGIEFEYEAKLRPLRKELSRLGELD